MTGGCSEPLFDQIASTQRALDGALDAGEDRLARCLIIGLRLLLLDELDGLARERCLDG